jgi:hypothetical protein
MRLRVLAALLLVSLRSLAVAADEDPRLAAALEAVAKWIALMDAGQYETCWDELAQTPKQQVPKKQWLGFVAAPRRGLGDLKTRKQIKAAYLPSLKDNVPTPRGLPDEEGAVIQFESSFEKQEGIVETIAVIHEKDGQWRVGYYLVRPRHTPSVYELPEGYHGWVLISSKRPDCPPIPSESEKPIFRIPSSGVLCTSSELRSVDYWEDDEYYFVGVARTAIPPSTSPGVGRKVRLLSTTNCGPRSPTQGEFLSFFIGTEAEVNTGKRKPQPCS